MKKNILFVCHENSARSQMAEAFFNRLNKNPKYAGLSAGLKAADSIKPLAVEVMKEAGIDISGQKPKNLTFEMIKAAERIITMGCIKTCPAAPPEKTLDWMLEDPTGKPIEDYRRIRDEIKDKVGKLVEEIGK